MFRAIIDALRAGFRFSAPLTPGPVPTGASVAYVGKCSVFGGPHDKGVSPSEGLALFDPSDLGKPIAGKLFLPSQPQGTTGLARRLDPTQHYIACRWDYRTHGRNWLRNTTVSVQAKPGGPIIHGVRPVDWGPHERTGRVADLSPGLALALGVSTDDTVSVFLPPAP